MEQITSAMTGRAFVASYNTVAVAPASPAQVTQTTMSESGQGSQGNSSQGRGKDEADAYRPMSFQAVLLASTTLSNLQDVLSRLGSGHGFSVVDRGSLSYLRAMALPEQSRAATEGIAPEEGGTDETITIQLSGEDASQARSAVPSGDSYYGYNWVGSGQLLDAARQATQAYLQGLTAVPLEAETAYAQKAEVLNLVA